MHTQPVLQKFFRESLPEVHQTRSQALIVAVDAVARGARVSITGLGRSLADTGTRIKHRVKRMDRLIGNRLLSGQRKAFYRAIALRLLASCPQPMILIDWSDFSADRQQQLLRASLAVGSRAITLYEELHPYRKLANRKVQHRFVDQLQRMVPVYCTPILIADAGFRVPFYRYVESLGWHWLGRIRNRDFVQWNGAPSDWISAKSLHGIASIRAQDLGDALWVRDHPLAGRLVLIMQHLRGRKHRSLAGSARRSRLSRKHAASAREPWLLIASHSLQDLSAKQIVRLYKSRMQIEEGFRDTKSVAYGLGIANGRHTTFMRAANLLLIAALASFLLWMIGCLAEARDWRRMVSVNSSSTSPPYSPVFLARLLVQFTRNRLPLSCLDDVARIVRQYTQSVLIIE
ncbi:IS4 family transposase [Solimonas terrae]|uniref:IS4 family transposase n=1 Tax=Solimonas terrae TaxID=1396819 RepID=A0A6M2BZA0_9GAMM|nr:IS4 family transposase [Solimonas terrae]NGY07067.1 IS4 family transposase [Solimonas terrae]